MSKFSLSDGTFLTMKSWVWIIIPWNVMEYMRSEGATTSMESTCSNQIHTTAQKVMTRKVRILKSSKANLKVTRRFVHVIMLLTIKIWSVIPSKNYHSSEFWNLWKSSLLTNKLLKIDFEAIYRECSFDVVICCFSILPELVCFIFQVYPENHEDQMYDVTHYLRTQAIIEKCARCIYVHSYPYHGHIQWFWLFF